MAALKAEVTRIRTMATEMSAPATIKSVFGRQVFDSRGNPTVEVDLYLSNDTTCFRAMVPSGASTGIYEALELRDGKEMGYKGKGVSKAVDNVNNIIAPALLGMDPTAQKAIDDKMVLELDGTEGENGFRKEKLGANAILAVSMAVTKAGASAKGVPLYQHIADLAGYGTSKMVLPVPSFNIINGGSHAGNKLPMQEFMMLPVGASSFKEAMKIGTEVYHTLKAKIKKEYGGDAVNVGDEGGFAPNILQNEAALDLVMGAIEEAGYADKVQLGSDIAASEFYKNGKYDLGWKDEGNPNELDAAGLQAVYAGWVEKYPIISIEDPFDQDDWDAWGSMTAALPDTQIVGDDLLVTNPKRVARAIEQKTCNALLLKVNQIGTISESIEAVKMSQAADWGVMASHRSGETEDSFIADLAVGLCVGQIKTGAPCRSERLAKYNQLLRIEEELGDRAVYAGAAFRRPLPLLES